MRLSTASRYVHQLSEISFTHWHRVQHQAHVEPPIFDATSRDRGLQGEGQVVGRSMIDRFYRGFRVLTRDWEPTSSGFVRPVASSRALALLSPLLDRIPEAISFRRMLSLRLAFLHLLHSTMPPCVPRPSDRPLVALIFSPTQGFPADYQLITFAFNRCAVLFCVQLRKN